MNIAAGHRTHTLGCFQLVAHIYMHMIKTNSVYYELESPWKQVRASRNLELKIGRFAEPPCLNPRTPPEDSTVH